MTVRIWLETKDDELRGRSCQSGKAHAAPSRDCVARGATWRCSATARGRAATIAGYMDIITDYLDLIHVTYSIAAK